MLLEVQHVRKEFQNRTHALTDASFSVSQGDFVSVIGPSGAGKTTLFRILNGSLRCDGGAILVNGVHFESADRRTRRAIQTTIGTIYQDFALVENATCRQNVLNACLPDRVYLEPEQALVLPRFGWVEPLRLHGSQNVVSTRTVGSYQTTLALGGWLPVKTIRTVVTTRPSVTVCGTPFGVKMFSEGALIVGFSDVDRADGSTANPAKAAVPTYSLGA